MFFNKKKEQNNSVIIFPLTKNKNVNENNKKNLIILNTSTEKFNVQNYYSNNYYTKNNNIPISNNNLYNLDNSNKYSNNSNNNTQTNDNSTQNNREKKQNYSSNNKYKQEEKVHQILKNYEKYEIESFYKPKPISYTISIKPKGLYNLGLNHYMNSLLQCLYYIPELRNYFIDNKNIFSDKHPVCKAFAEVMYGLKYDKKEYYEPIEFKRIMENKNILFPCVNAGDPKVLLFNLIDYILNELIIENEGKLSLDENINLTDKVEVFKETEKEVDKKILLKS